MADQELSKTVLYNEHLEPPDNLTTVPDTPGGHLSGETLISMGTGWHWAPAEPEARPGERPEGVTYGPVKPEATKAKASKAEAKPKEGSD